MSITDFKLSRLNPAQEILPFNCSDTDLNAFLFEDAKLFQSQLLAVTYLLESDTKTVAYFSILNDKIKIEDFETKSQWKKIPLPFTKRRNSYPAVKIGRLGIDVDHQGQGIGNDILNYIKILFLENNKTGCKFITVDAYRQSLGFTKETGLNT